MFVSTVLLVQGLLAIVGALASLLLALRINGAASAISSPSLRLLAAAFVVFSLALLMDALALLLYQPPHGHVMHGVGVGKRPREVSFLLVNRASMLAQPFYMIAYTLYAVSIYYSHLPLGDRRIYSLPLVALVYIDYNIAALVLLALAGYMVYERGSTRLRWLLFYCLLATSHVLAIMALEAISTIMLSISMSLRAMAPLLLLVYAIKR